MKIVSKFAAVSEQGLPETRLRRFGVPSGGALDQESFQLAVALAGINAPALEVVGGSIEIEAETSGCLAIVGADTSVSINGQPPKPGNARFSIAVGDRVTVALSGTGFAYYLAEGLPRSPVRLADRPSSLSSTIRILYGPQASLFDPNILEGEHTVSNEISRVGVRLTRLSHSHSFELRSEPACSGAVQITPDGTPIILGPDGPTIGGYPKAAVVCSADLDKVGQLRPGQMVRFQLITFEEARQALKERRQELARKVKELSLFVA